MPENLYQNFLNICNQIYGEKIIEPDSLFFGRNDRNIINFSVANRLGHYLALTSIEGKGYDFSVRQTLERLIKEWHDYEAKLFITIENIKSCLRDEPFIIVKTFSSFPHLTHDVDIIVRDIKLYKSLNFVSFLPDGLSHMSSIDNIDASNSFLQIHMGTDISWTGLKAISNDFLWNNTAELNFRSGSFLVPNTKLDFLLRVGHMAFELAHIKLGELLHVYKQLPLFVLENIKLEANAMGWVNTFDRMLIILATLHFRLFGFDLNEDLKSKKKILKSKLIFPFELPFALLVGGVVEKRAWKKILGVKYVIKDRVLRCLERAGF